MLQYINYNVRAGWVQPFIIHQIQFINSDYLAREKTNYILYEFSIDGVKKSGERVYMLLSFYW